MTTTAPSRPSHPLEAPGAGRRWWLADRAIQAVQYAALLAVYHWFILFWVAETVESGWALLGLYIAMPTIAIVSSRLYRRAAWYIPVRDFGRVGLRPAWRWALSIWDALLLGLFTLGVCAWSPARYHSTVVAIIVIAACAVTGWAMGHTMGRAIGLRHVTGLGAEIAYLSPRVVAMTVVALKYRHDVYHGPVTAVVIPVLLLCVLSEVLKVMCRNRQQDNGSTGPGGRDLPPGPDRPLWPSPAVLDERLERVRAIRRAK